MAKQTVEVMVAGGKATAAPPIGPALGPLGVPINQVIAKINEKTKDFAGMQVPVKIIADSVTKEFDVTVGTPPTSELIKKEAKAQEMQKALLEQIEIKKRQKIARENSWEKKVKKMLQ